MRFPAMWALLLLGSSVARAETPAEEVAKRLETITSKSTRARLDVPRLAFTSNLTWDAPTGLDQALFGLPEMTVLDKAKTLVGFGDPDTAFITAYLAEYSNCPNSGCAKVAPESWLRATAVLEKVTGIWQPVAWSITSPIPGDAQVAAMADGIVPDKLARDVTGAEPVALLFETTIADAKTFAATVAKRPETVMLGSELGERYTGAQVAKQITAWNLVFRVRDGARGGVEVRQGRVGRRERRCRAGEAPQGQAHPVPRVRDLRARRQGLEARAAPVHDERLISARPSSRASA